MFATLRRDIQAFMDNDPAARSRLEILLAYPGLHALWFHRLAPLWLIAPIVLLLTLWTWTESAAITLNLSLIHI